MPTSTAAPAREHIAWVSGSNTGHLDLMCTGLDMARERGVDPAEEYETVTGPTFADLFPKDIVTPCRVCALEPVLLELFAGLDITTPRTEFVVTDLGAVASRRRHYPPPVNEKDRERVQRIHDDASARLRRLASRADLGVTQVLGHRPVMYGPLPPAVAHALGERADVACLEAQGDVDPSAVQMFWTLHRTAKMTTAQAWDVARAVVG